MPHLRVVIAAIQIASGAQFANPERLIYSEQNLADGSVIASQQPLPICKDIIPPSPSSCVNYRNGDAHAFLLLCKCPDVDEPKTPRNSMTIIQKENRKSRIQYIDKLGKQINEPIQNTNQSNVDTDGNGPCASGRAFINNSCLPLPYILKEQVESHSMAVKEWRKEMDQWKEYWKKNPKEELHGCTDNNGFDTGLCVTLPKE